MTKLAISPDLSLPTEAVTEACGFLGRRGSGKSYAAQKLAEEFHRARAQFVALDPVGNWWALRLAADGKGAGIPIPVFGGLQGDVPLEPTAGKLVADTIVDRGISAVIDVSQFESDADKSRFARAFCERFYFRKKSAPSAVHVFLEEAQEFIPQNPGRDDAQMLHAFTRLAKLGRNFGIGLSMLSQRPQEVNKKVLNLAELLFVFQLTGVHERKAVEAWIGDKGIDGEDIEAELPKLERGHPHAWSPAWLKVSKIIGIGEKWTFDASSTPKLGAQASPVRELSPIDLEQLRTNMATAIEKAKADDPKELRKEIASLRTQLTKAQQKAPALPAATIVVDERAVKRAVDAALTPLIAAENSRLSFLRRTIANVSRDAKALVGSLGDLEAINLDAIAAPNGNAHRGNGHGIGARAEDAPRTDTAGPRQPSRAVTSRAIPRATEPRGDLSRGQQKILNALAELEALGVEQATRHQLGMVAGYNLTGGSGAQHIADLGALGLIELPDKGAVRLTDSGRAAADASATPSSLDELHERVLGKLSAGQRKIAEHLIAIYPDSISRAYLGEATGYNLTGGSGAQHVADLVTVGAAKIPGSGKVVASDLLFPESLR